jgi:hypothetical protein
MPSPLLGNRFARFARRLLASGLVPLAELETLVENFDAARNDKKNDDPLEEFGEFLVQKDALTEWQLNNLREDRYKGFFFEGRYKLIKHVGSNEKCMRYVAEDLDSQRIVVLAIEHRPLKDAKHGERAYTVEEYQA